MNQPGDQTQNITGMLRRWSEGDKWALDELMPIVYEELHRQAARFMRREQREHTLQTTALIHEAYLKLVDQKDIKWESRTHFYGIAARAMRQVLVDYARTKRREKRGGDNVEVTLDEDVSVASDEKNVDLIALDEALTRLAGVDPQQARVVELRYFAGLSLDETAEVLRISRATVARDWSVAKVWLHRELTR